MGFWVNFLINMAVSWVVGEISKDQQEKAIAEAEARHAGVLLNKRSNVANLPVIYGQRKVGGTIVFTATSGGNNAYLYIVLALCEGEVEEIGDIYIDDVLSTDPRFGPIDLSITIGNMTLDSMGEGSICNKHLGSDSQTADAMLVDANIGWTADHIGKGVTYLACRFMWNNDVFSAMPTIHAMVKGRKVYDPRTSTTAYSTNPALCLRDYLTNTRYGKGLATSAIDDTAISAAANQCDNLVTPYIGAAQQKLFECNTVLDTSRTLMSNVKVLLSGMRGIMPYQQGIYSLVIESEIASGVTPFAFDESNIVGGINIQSEKKSTKFNRCIATYVNPNANWQRDQMQWPPAGSTEENNYLSADGEELIQRIELETITDPYTAEDIAEIVVKRSREGKLVKFKATSEALQVTVPDIITVTHSTPAWSAKPFRVLNVQMPPDGTVTIEAVEHQDSIYPWSSKTEKDNIPDTNLPDPFSVAAPTPISVTEELYTTTKSKGVQARAIFTWAAPNDAFVNEYEAEYKISSVSAWTFITRTSSTEARVEDLTPNTYDFRARAINSMGVKSAYAVMPNTVFAGLTAPPADISNFSVRAMDGSAHISWNRITDLDVINGGYIRIRHANLTTGATWANGRDIGEALAGTQTHAVLPLLAGTYMAKAVDSTGKFSNNAVLAITTVPNILNFNVVETATESPGFSGTKTEMYVDNNVLKLTGFSRYLTTEAGDRIITEAGDYLITETGDQALIQPSGTYNFNNTIDLGAVFTARVVGNLQASSAAVGDLLDNRDTNIDTWQNFDGQPSDDISAELQIRTTQDDTSASPSWTDWAPHLTGDYSARGFQFRVVVTNNDPYFNISITSLSATVDMPDRIDRASDVSVSSSGTTITFSAAFHATPTVGITMQDANSGDYFRITSTSSTSFTVNCYNSSNTGIARTINWQAAGYGRAA